MDLAGIKASTDELVAQLPAIEAFIDAQLKKIDERIALVQQTFADMTAKACAEVETVVGGTLADVTTERQQIFTDLHELLDRIQIVPRKTEPIGKPPPIGHSDPDIFPI